MSPSKLCWGVLNSQRDLIAALPAWWRQSFIYPLLIVPLLAIAVVYGISESNFFGWGDRTVAKAQLEILHPALLAIGVALAGLGWWLNRDPVLAFVAVLIVFPLSRELMGQGSSGIMIVGLLGVIFWGHRHTDDLKGLLQSRLATSALALCFFSYGLSQALDRGVIKRIGWLFTGDTSWRVPHSSNLEEGLETIGGAFLLVAAITVICHVYAQRHQGRDSF